MSRRSVFYLYGFLLISIVTAAPSKQIEGQATPTTLKQQTLGITVTPKYPIEDIQLIQPHFITLEDFESLLRRAGELFRPNAYLIDDDSNTAAPTQPSPAQNSKQAPSVVAATPYHQIQPLAIQPFNFYMPLFEQDNRKLDAKSRRMEHIVPPPAPVKGDIQTNYYALKPKKLPKKFNAGTKQVNMKWLNSFEKEALTDANGQLPKAVYLLNDERNRINFDDSFFGVDMQVKIPNNQPHKERNSNDSTGTQAQEDEFLNQGEEGGDEDLVAAAGRQVAHTVQQG